MVLQVSGDGKARRWFAESTLALLGAFVKYREAKNMPDLRFTVGFDRAEWDTIVAGVEWTKLTYDKYECWYKMWTTFLNIPKCIVPDSVVDYVAKHKIFYLECPYFPWNAESTKLLLEGFQSFRDINKHMPEHFDARVHGYEWPKIYDHICQIAVPKFSLEQSWHRMYAMALEYRSNYPNKLLLINATLEEYCGRFNLLEPSSASQNYRKKRPHSNQIEQNDEEESQATDAEPVKKPLAISDEVNLASNEQHTSAPILIDNEAGVSELETAPCAANQECFITKNVATGQNADPVVPQASLPGDSDFMVSLIQQLRSKLSHSEKNSLTRMAVYETRIRELEDLLQKWQAHNEALLTRCRSLEDAVASQQTGNSFADLQRKDQMIASLTENNHMLQGTVHTLHDQLAASKKACAKAEASRAELMKQAAQFSKDLATASSKISALQSNPPPKTPSAAAPPQEYFVMGPGGTMVKQDHASCRKEQIHLLRTTMKPTALLEFKTTSRTTPIWLQNPNDAKNLLPCFFDVDYIKISIVLNNLRITSMNVVQPEGPFREYWITVFCVAERVRTRQELLAAACSGSLVGAGALLGSLIMPGLGTIVGGTIGITFGATFAIFAAYRRSMCRYSAVLRLSNDQGVAFVHQIHTHFGKFISNNNLEQYLLQTD